MALRSFFNLKNSLYMGIIIVSVCIQKVFIFWRGNSLEHRENFLLSGVPYYDNLLIHNLVFMLWIFPVVIVLFLFNGEAKQLYHGYGILKVIRGELRHKIILKKVASICFRCFCILFLYAIVMQERMSFSRMFVESFFMLYLTFVAILLFQFLLEHFFIDNIVAFNSILVWLVTSVMLSNIFRLNDNYEILQYAFIPNFAFSQRNGLFQIQSTPNIYLEIAVLGMIIILEIICSVVAGSKKDFI